MRPGVNRSERRRTRGARALVLALAMAVTAACGVATSRVAKPEASTPATPATSAVPSIVAPLAIGPRRLQGDKPSDDRYAPPPEVAVWDDGSVVAAYAWGRKILLWRAANEPKDISVPETFLARLDASGGRVAALVDGPREGLTILDARHQRALLTKALSKSESVGWLGDQVLLAGVAPGGEARRIDASGNVSSARELAYDAELVAASADGTAFVVKRSHALSFWLDLFHGSNVKRIEDAPRPHGAAVFGTTAVVVTEEPSTNPDWPPGRRAIAFDIDTGERRDVPNAERPTAIAATRAGFVLGFEDGRAAVVDASFAVIASFPGTGRVLAVGASPDGSKVALLRQDGSIEVTLARH